MYVSHFLTNACSIALNHWSACVRVFHECSPGVPKYVVGPDGSPLTVADLPKADTKRWVIKRKAMVVAAVRGGLLSLEDACARYMLTADEFLSWQVTIDRYGLAGLRHTYQAIPIVVAAANCVGARRGTECRSCLGYAGTIILPTGQSAIPASFKWAQANGMPTIVTARSIAVTKCPSASHQPASTSHTTLPSNPSGPVPKPRSPVYSARDTTVAER